MAYLYLLPGKVEGTSYSSLGDFRKCKWRYTLLVLKARNDDDDDDKDDDDDDD